MPLFLLNPITRYLTIAVVALSAIGGVYLKGRYDGNALCEARVEKARLEWEAKLAEQAARHDENTKQIIKSYDAKVGDLNTEIDKLNKKPPKVIYRYKQKIIKVPEYINIYIPKEVDKPVPKGFVDLHDTAAQGKPLQENVPNADKPSDKSLTDVGKTVATNYYSCNIIRARLESLQKLVNDFQEKQKALQ